MASEVALELLIEAQALSNVFGDHLRRLQLNCCGCAMCLGGGSLSAHIEESVLEAVSEAVSAAQVRSFAQKCQISIYDRGGITKRADVDEICTFKSVRPLIAILGSTLNRHFQIVFISKRDSKRGTANILAAMCQNDD
jgi:hypothetical protein